MSKPNSNSNLNSKNKEENKFRKRRIKRKMGGLVFMGRNLPRWPNSLASRPAEKWRRQVGPSRQSLPLLLSCSLWLVVPGCQQRLLLLARASRQRTPTGGPVLSAGFFLNRTRGSRASSTEPRRRRRRDPRADGPGRKLLRGRVCGYLSCTSLPLSSTRKPPHHTAPPP